MEMGTSEYETMVMYLVNLNLATKVCVKVHGKVCEKVHMRVHVLTKLIKCPIQYLQESLKSSRCPRERKTEV